MTARQRCPRCPHAGHNGVCRGKWSARCIPFFGPGGSGYLCGWRPPCPCSRRVCKCGTVLAVAVELAAGAKTLDPSAGEVMLVSVTGGTAGQAPGRLAVWKLADGYLACRDLPEGQDPGEGEWRAVEHDEQACGYDLRLRAG